MSASERTGPIAVASHLWSSPVHAAAADLVDPQPGETIVDLGAGFGAATLHLARRMRPGARVVAVDPSRLMRTALRARRIIDPGRDLIEVQAGTAERLHLLGHSVDAVVAMNVIHLLRDVDAAATELARVLRPSGRLLFIEEDIDDPRHRFHHTEPHAPDGPTVNDLARALDQTGQATTIGRRDLGGQPVTTLSRHDIG
ncbi:MAG: class I SAM-dependent methyltransferase [Acidimicrobiales bacterium]